MTADLADFLENLHRELAPLIDSSPEPMRSRLQAIATGLAGAASQAAQAQAAQTARITARAEELRALGAAATPAAPVPAPGFPASFPAPPPAAAPAIPAASPTPMATSLPGAATGGQSRIIAEGVWLLSRKPVSPNCEAFVFEIGDGLGGAKELRLEAYRLNGKTFVKTRSPLAKASPGWMASQDSYGDFFLCHREQTAGITDERLRKAADFALN